MGTLRVLGRVINQRIRLEHEMESPMGRHRSCCNKVPLPINADRSLKNKFYKDEIQKPYRK
jgi:hypothetical protein